MPSLPPGDERDDFVGSLLVECMERLSRGERGAVEASCQAHPEHAAEIRERIGVLLQMGLVSDAPGDDFPERLDQFRLLRRLGGGGMGVVFEAEQEPIGRTVALKLIRPEQLYFPRARERFRRETEAVAKLQHPGIVSIFTVGEAEGVPYFAMEKIAGATLAEVLERVAGRAPESLGARDFVAAVGTEPADNGAPETRELFADSWTEVCVRVVARMADALAHAHSRGVLHRDIKPSNIVVTPQARVVLLDFGLASSQSELRMTLAGSAIGSVLYMAPEQLRGKVAEIDERTDVYSLGVTLYELLTLQVPYVGEDAERARAAILEGRPPSIRVRNRAVSRDLEVVCFTAIERDPSRRYASMEDFASDLRNVLAHRPIVARPPSAAMHALRWIQRHPTGSTALALGALIALGVPSAYVVQQRAHNRELRSHLQAALDARKLADDASARAEAESAKAKLEARDSDAVAAFLVDLFGAADPNRSRGRDPTARDLLARGLERLESQLADQPEVQARLLERIGQSYANIDLYNEALPPLERAVALRRELHDACDSRTGRALWNLGKAQRLAGRPEAIATLREARETLIATLGADDPVAVQGSTELAVALLDRGQAPEALRLLEEASRTERALGGDQRALRQQILSARAVALVTLSQWDQAEQISREALQLGAELYRWSHPARVGDLNCLAATLQALGRSGEATEVYDELVELARTLYGERSTAYALFQSNRALLIERLGRADEAIELQRRSLETIEALLGPDHPHAVRMFGNLGNALCRRDRYEEAQALYERYFAELERRLGPRHPRTNFARQRLGIVCEARGDFERAERLLRGARDTAGSPGRPDPWFELTLASVLRRDAATRAESEEIYERWLDSRDLEIRIEARYGCARIALDERRRADAEELLRQALEQGAAGDPQGWAWPACRVQLALIGAERGEDAGGLEAAIDELALRIGRTHPELHDACERAARCFESAGDETNAKRWRERVAAALPH